MNKIWLLAGIAAVIGMASCKEVGPAINFGGGAKAVDTTYTAEAEKPQSRVVLVEEFTGCSCPPCPSGHLIIYGPGGIKEQHPDQVAVIAYHIFNFPQAEPVHGHAKFDFRTQDATDVGAHIFGGIGSLPNGGIDRKKNTAANNVLLFEKPLWSQAVNGDVSVKPAANLVVTSSYDAATRNAIVKVHIAYTQDVAKKQSLTLAIVESNILDAQKTDTSIIDNYTHRSVLRDIITQYYGDGVIDSIATKKAGRVYERTFSFAVNKDWNADNCALVAFISNNEADDKEVVQAAEVNLK